MVEIRLIFCLTLVKFNVQRKTKNYSDSLPTYISLAYQYTRSIPLEYLLLVYTKMNKSCPDIFHSALGQDIVYYCYFNFESRNQSFLSVKTILRETLIKVVYFYL